MPDGLWFQRLAPGSEAGPLLFCFPAAGGGAAAYRAWAGQLGADIEVVGIRLPGRENRFAERRYRRMPELAADLTAALRPWLTRPFAFFGHSLGALVAFETARRLAASGPEPVHLFAAACRAPQLPAEEPRLHDLPSGALVERLRRYGGMPAEVLAERDLLRTLLPMIRDDFEIAESYRPARVGGLRCPVTALGGAADRSVSRSDLAAWRGSTTGPFELATVPGGHFAVGRPESGVPALVGSTLRASPG
jgi:medium-chain acyl-[acyl-carrier-protein] hydrolase